MAGLDELSAILFNGTNENSVTAESGAPQTTIIYGVALSNSANGEVSIRLDNAIYAADDLDDDYEYITLTDDDDDVNSIDEDEELVDPEDEDTETIYWSPEDDDAVGSDDE